MTPVHANFIEIWHLVDIENMKYVLALQFLYTIQHRFQNFKVWPKDTFDAYFKTDLYTQMFHLLVHVIVDLNRFGYLELLSSTPY